MSTLFVGVGGKWSAISRCGVADEGWLLSLWVGEGCGQPLLGLGVWLVWCGYSLSGFTRVRGVAGEVWLLSLGVREVCGQPLLIGMWLVR